MVKMLGDMLLLVAALEFVGFVVLYHLLAAWRETQMGRHVMVFMGVIASILVVAAADTMIGPLPGRDLSRSLIFGALGTVGAWRIGLLLKEQAEARRNPAPSGRHHRKD